MKKTHLVAAIGTLALVANLILPGLALAQTQTGDVDINCPTGPATDITMSNTPDNFSFDDVTLDYSGYDAESSIQDNITAAADYPVTTQLQVTGKTVSGCLSSETPWNVTVVASNLTNGSAGTIPATSVGVRTGANIATVTCTDATSNVCYIAYTGGTNPPANAYSGAAAPANGPASETASDYTTKVNAAVEIMGWNDAIAPDVVDGLNGSASVGVGFAIDAGIEWNEQSGTYTGTVTYTFAET